jgi:arsenical resistance operon trans-acting repressor ArsD
MPHLDVFDPPMCCSSGVCGPSVDPLLAAFAADVDWLMSQGVSVTRFNLAQDPQAFVAHPLVKDTLQRDGDRCLPLLILNGEIVATGAYPRRDELGYSDHVLHRQGGRGEDVARVCDRRVARRARAPSAARLD